MVDNRSNIMTCALSLFASRGYDAVGIQEIVDQAGISKPTLYHYFGSKNGLLEAILRENYLLLLNRLRQTTDYQGDLPHTLNRIVFDYFWFAREHGPFYRFQLALYYASPQSEAFQTVAPFLQEQHDLLEEMFTKASKDHGNMKGRQKAYAATFLGMINTYISLFLNRYVEIDDTLVYQAVHQFSHGIYS